MVLAMACYGPLLVHGISKKLQDITESYARSLLKEEEAVISRGTTLGTKQELQQLEDHINYASFLSAAGDSDSNGRDGYNNLTEADKDNLRIIKDWIGAARMTAFCLADQIDMYAIPRPSNIQLYGMKCDIGMRSIEELTESIKRHKTVGQEDGQMPSVVQSTETEYMRRLSGMLPFIGPMPSVPPEAIIEMKEEIKKIKAFLAGPNSCLFITGGPGSGKTTLMKNVYDEQRKKDVYETDKKCFWMDITESAGLGSLLKTMLEESKVDFDSINEFQMLKMVRDTLVGKECLIVLDNVKDTYVVYSLKIMLEGLKKWKIICLSRTEDVKKYPDQEVLRLPRLHSFDSLKLLLSAAFCNFKSTILQRENIISTVRNDLLRDAIKWKDSTSLTKLQPDQLLTMINLLNDILHKCQDNPSNIWSIGILLRVSPLEKWKEIVEQIDGTKIYEIRDTHIQLGDARLKDAATRNCFLYCLAFSNPKKPESSEIPAKKLIRLWTSEGFVQDSANKSEEQEAESLLHELIKKNLLVAKKRDFDGTVLKCSVNEHMRPMAEKMCEQQKFCDFVVDHVVGASSLRWMTRRLPISWNILGRGKKKPLSDRYRMLAVHPDRGSNEVPRTHTLGSFPSVFRSQKKEVPRTLELGKEIRLRSLLYINTGKIEDSKLDLSFGRTYMLLRTLELQGARLAKLSPGIDCLVCLRYLGLRNTQLEDLPLTWQSLKRLICLDIRDTNIAEVADVSLLREMRHLYLTKSFRSHSVGIKKGLDSLENLQTLSGVVYRDSSPNISFKEQISHLRRLRKLSVKKVPSTAPGDISQAISGMDSLRSLAISCDKVEEEEAVFDLSYLKIGKNLCKLKLGGPMDKIGTLEPSMQSITFLYLWDSKLQDNLDLLRTLQGLTNLLVLSLLNTSTTGKMSCGEDSYKKLKKLSIISMQNLSSCEFGQNAMNKLEKLVFAKCGKLKSLPDGIHRLVPLPEVHLTEMHPNFCKDAKDKLGDNKVHVLRDALSHIVSITAATEGES